MKSVIKSALLFFLIILVQCKKDSVFKVHIADANFLNALIERGVDINGDSIISPEEAEIITFLDISGENISDLAGIEAFINLDTLLCLFNNLISLDVSGKTALKLFACRNNHLTSLNVSNNKALILVDCSENELKSLNVSKDISLKALSCGANHLTRLDISNSANLTSLYCSFNWLSSLNVSNNRTLISFDCSENLLNSLDISNNNGLRFFSCSSNKLTDLDVSKNASLERIEIEGMPSLTKVCVWEVPFPPAGVTLVMLNSPNVFFSTDCNK